MKFFFIFFALATALCLFFYATDEAGGGAGIGACIFGGLAVGVGGYNWIRNGSPLAEGRNLNKR